MVRNDKTDAPGFAAIETLQAVLARRLLKYPDASGHIPTCKARRGCREGLEDGWSVVCVFDGS